MRLARRRAPRTETSELVDGTPGPTGQPHLQGPGESHCHTHVGFQRQGVLQHLGTRGHTILTGPTGSRRTTRAGVGWTKR